MKNGGKEMLDNDGATGMSMEDRVSNLENIAQLSIRLHRMTQESLTREQEERRQMGEMMQESLRREQQERQQMGEVMDQLIQAVALIQADIVRIDETRS